MSYIRHARIVVAELGHPRRSPLPPLQSCRACSRSVSTVSRMTKGQIVRLRYSRNQAGRLVYRYASSSSNTSEESWVSSSEAAQAKVIETARSRVVTYREALKQVGSLCFLRWGD
jgi:hypothetical protein